MFLCGAEQPPAASLVQSWWTCSFFYCWNIFLSIKFTCKLIHRCYTSKSFLIIKMAQIIPVILINLLIPTFIMVLSSLLCNTFERNFPKRPLNSWSCYNCYNSISFWLFFYFNIITQVKSLSWYRTYGVKSNHLINWEFRRFYHTWPLLVEQKNIVEFIISLKTLWFCLVIFNVALYLNLALYKIEHM